MSRKKELNQIGTRKLEKNYYNQNKKVQKNEFSKLRTKKYLEKKRI